MNSKINRGRMERGRTVLAVFALTVGLWACDLDSLLEVDIPGRVQSESLDDPRLAETLVNSVIADVECSWDNYVAAAAHHSDEWIASSGNSTMARWGLRDIPPTFASMATAGCAASYGLYTPLHGARVQAESNFDRISGYTDTEVPDRAEFLAIIRAYGAWPLIAFSEGFCGTPLDGGANVLGPMELAAVAETKFTDAIGLAQAAGRSDLENMARVGLARALLTQEKYADVITQAAMVPDGFLFVATRDITPGDRQNAHYEAINGLATDDAAQKHATIAPNYRALEWMGTPDPRVAVYNDGSLGFDFFTEHWRHDKANSFDAPTMMASWREAQLFMAEAYAMTDQLPEAIAILDELHTRAGIPPVTAADLPTQDDVITHVIEERRREFFSEGAHRLRDHLRWRGTQFGIPFLGEPGSIHPNGRLLDPNTGAPLREYEDATCFPVPTVEGVG
ncbi:MAG: RagB/SusD family nutrient uptake outer membrane protein [Gemmatimonadota bacterium]|nr:RagB/SusD family nutrient uptake outer membrane protein [Gemmatimonadota bacterium]